MESEDLGEVGLSHVGLKARSPEGHAARAMHIKGDEYIWVEIQEKTFKNWVNEQIRPLGMSIENLQTDFSDGLKLIALIEVLQKRKLKKIRKPLNQHQCLENVQTALQAMASDNIKLVNIGNTDIVEGNLKLILGLIWSLILRYQIGRTNFPPKKLMLSWLQAVLPSLHISNFTSDWNSGIALSALLDFCKPGLFPHWKTLSVKNSVENCRTAMHVARDEFSVPMILTPEDLASHNLDELSGMTYLSYFMKDDSPGYRATLSWVQKQLPQFNIRNFTSDWNDGHALCALVKSYGANIPDYTELKKERSFWEQNLQHGIIGGESLGVRPLLKPKELSDSEVEHLGVMAYLARFQWVKPLKKPRDKISITGINLNNVHINKPANFKINFLDSSVDEKKIRLEVRFEKRIVDIKSSFSKIGGTGSFIPSSVGMHELMAFYDEEMITGCPLHIRVHPDISKILYSGIDLCALGSVVEVLINSNGVGSGNVFVEAQSPSGKLRKCTVAESEEFHTATFTPDEIGEWKIIVTYAGEHIHGSPFTCYVCDPAKIKVQGLGPGLKGKEKSFIIDASGSGWGEVKIELLHNSCPVPISVDEQGNGIYIVTFLPMSSGRYHLNITFNSINIKGSPFSFKIVDTEKELKGSEFESRLEETKFKKEKFAPLKELQQNHLIPDGIGSVYSKYTDSIFKSSEDLVKTNSNIFSSRENLHQSLNATEKSPISKTFNSSTSQENLSFHQRAEIVGNKLMAHKENLKSSKAPAPPPKKTASHDSTELKTSEVFNSETFKHSSKSSLETAQFTEQIANHNSNVHSGLEKNLFESNDNLGAKPKIHSKKSKEGRDTEVLASSSNIKHELNDYTFVSSSNKHKKESIDISQVITEGEGLRLVPVKQPTTFSLQAPWLKQDDIQATVTAPSGREIPLRLEFVTHGKYRVEYITPEVGEHSIEITVAGKHLIGSPFQCFAYDASQIKVGKIPNGTVGKSVEFEINGAEAGSGNLEILVNGGHVTSNVKSLGNHCFLASFIPHTATTHTIEMKFNGHHVPGSPWKCEVSETNKKRAVRGEVLKSFSSRQPVSFEITALGYSKENIKVNVNGPTMKNVPVVVKKTSNTTFDVSFNPEEIGPHQVLVMLDDTPLPGSPFTCNVHDVTKVKVSKLEPGFIGKPCTFQVDASQAGEGRLELAVETRKSSVRADVTTRSRGLYDVTFIPQEVISHYVHIRFNEEDVPGCPFKIEIHPSSGKGHQSVVANGDGLKQGLVGSTNAFDIETNGLEGIIEVRVTGPNGTAVPVSVVNTKHNTYRVEYQLQEIGTYKVEVLHQGAMISSKPFLVEVCDPSRVKVVDVEDGIIGRDQVFKVDVSRAGRGNLNLSITAAGRDVKHNIREVTGGVYEVTYVPYSDHPHKIEVYYNGHQAPGCPQIVEIRDPSHSIIAHGSGLKSSQCGKTASFFIETGGFGEAKDFDIIVISPHGSPLPVKCYQQKDGSLLAEWPAQQAGNHKIEILYAGKPIAGSPFSCQVFDATKVTLHKMKTTSFAVGELISFTLNHKDAGYAELDVTVTSPLGKHLPIEVKGTSDGEGELIEFTPTVPGKYKFAITYGGIEVPGSPVTFIVQDSGVPKVEGTGLSVAQFDSPATFKILAAGLWGQPQVAVNGPETEAEVSIEEEAEGIFIVSYVPLEVGLFDIKILWNQKEIPGSPYHPRVVNTSKMRIIGGLENLVDEENHIPLIVGEEKRIPFDISEAGPGKPKGEVQSPSGVLPSKFTQTGSHRYHLTFTPKEGGEHQIYVYFGELPLPMSPFIAYAEELGPAPDHTRVVLRGHGLTGAKVGAEAEFIIDGSEAGPGSPEVSLGGVKADIPVQILPLGNNIYRVLYSPTVPGMYLLNVMWSERQVKGCPLKVNVSTACDAQKVACSGDGLRGGTVGKEIKSFIDTRKAGPGELTAHCMGPHKVAYCELYDHRDGTFTLYLKPQEGGRHVLTIKYGEEHVPGSPFTLRIAGAPDASKVRVYGPGIEPGVLATYQSRFICDTRGAGAGQLTVRIRGPKGAFRVEMQRESQKDRTILCKYDPTEPGDYRLEVKWSGEHVPGSPFMVMIFDTQEELNHYIQGQYQSQSGGHPPLPPADYFGGSLTYSTGFGQMSWRGSTAEL